MSYDLAPAPPPLPSVSSTADTQEDWERETGGGGKGVAEEPNHTTAESLVLDKSLTTLWLDQSNKNIRI
jgi:hypothetical protein